MTAHETKVIEQLLTAIENAQDDKSCFAAIERYELFTRGLWAKTQAETLRHKWIGKDSS